MFRVRGIHAAVRGAHYPQRVKCVVFREDETRHSPVVLQKSIRVLDDGPITFYDAFLKRHKILITREQKFGIDFVGEGTFMVRGLLIPEWETLHALQLRPDIFTRLDMKNVAVLDGFAWHLWLTKYE